MQIPKQIVRVIVLIFIAVALSAVILFALKNKLSTKAKQISDRRAMAISLDKRESNLVALKGSYNIVSDNISKARSLFPEIDNMDELVEAIDKVSMEFGGTSTIKFENQTGLFGQNTRKLDFTLIFSGRKEFFSRFIKAMKDMDYFIEIRKIEIKSSSENVTIPDSMTVNASIFIRI